MNTDGPPALDILPALWCRGSPGRRGRRHAMRPGRRRGRRPADGRRMALAGNELAHQAEDLAEEMEVGRLPYRRTHYEQAVADKPDAGSAVRQGWTVEIARGDSRAASSSASICPTPSISAATAPMRRRLRRTGHQRQKPCRASKLADNAAVRTGLRPAIRLSSPAGGCARPGGPSGVRR